MCTHHRPKPYVAADLDTLRNDSELGAETVRGGRVHRVLVNRTTRLATTLTADEAAAFAAVVADARDGRAGGLIAELRDRGFLTAPHATDTARWSRARTALATLDLRFARGHRLVAALHRRGGRHLFHPLAVVVQALIAAVGAIAVVHTFADASLRLRLTPAQVPFALAISLFAVALHECAHALVVVHHGRRVDAIGLRLHLGTPAFYVESVDALLLTRRQRLIQAVAGSWAEWMVTSFVAVWVNITPTAIGLAILARFVMLNSLTIVTNLLPFTGLDGQLLLADLVGEPDLGASARGAFGDAVIAVLGRQPVSRRQRVLAGYAALNGLVAAGLLATAGLFWYSMFGGIIATLLAHGPLGWLVLTTATVLILQPAFTAALPRIGAAAGTAAELGSRLRFRMQWHWRVGATQALAAALPELRGADDTVLGIVAGQLRRVRSHRPELAGITHHCHLHRQARSATGRPTVHPAGTGCSARRRGVVVELDTTTLTGLLRIPSVAA